MAFPSPIDSATVFLALAFGLTGLAALGLLIWALREPYMLDCHPQQLLPPAWAGPPDRSVPGLRLALVTDLHAEWLRIRPDRLAKALADAAIDAIVFGGDLTGRQFKPERALPWLTAIQNAAQSSGSPIPCYAVIGNHDSQRSIDLLAAHGFTILKNQAACLTDSSGRTWLLCGLDILKKGRPDWVGLQNRLTSGQQLIPPVRRIVLAHNPDTLFSVTQQSAAFFLAGHFHGGQIYMPFHLEFLLLRREKIGRMGYHKGSFEYHSLSSYISRGLGSVLFPLRLKSTPELPLLELLPPERFFEAQSQT